MLERAGPESRRPVSDTWPVLESLRRWAAAHRRSILLLVVLGSALPRIFYFVEIGSGPCVRQHRWTESDMSFFDRWAREIAAGDWLSDQPLHPYHGWHDEVARRSLERHPRRLAASGFHDSAASSAEDRGRALWSHWLGGKRFYQEPLYPYLLGLVYRWLGADARWVLAAQALVGILTNLLIYLIAGRLFGEPVAIVAAAMAVLYAPFLFYESILLRASWIVFAGLGLTHLILVAASKDRRRWWLAAGLASGAAVLLKVTFLPMFVGLVILLVWRRVGGPSSLSRSLPALLGGFALVLSPLVVRNVAVGVPPLGLAGGNAVTFVYSNMASYPPQAGHFVDADETSRIMAETGGRTLPAVLETLGTHSVPSYAGQLWGKFAALWHGYEMPNNANFYYYRLHGSTLSYLPLALWIVGPLAAVGLALSRRHSRRCWPLYLLVACHVVSVLLTFVASRYRVPLVAALLPFAALTIVRCLEWSRDRPGRTAIAVSAVVVLSLWTTRPGPAARSPIRPIDYVVPYLVHYDPLSREAWNDGDWERVASLLGDSLRFEPGALRDLDAPTSDGGVLRRRLAPRFARVHARYAHALRRVGRSDAAAEHERRASELTEFVRLDRGPRAGP